MSPPRKNNLQNNSGDPDQHDTEHNLPAVIVLFVEGLASGTAMPRASATAEKETRAGEKSCQDEPDRSEASQSSVMRHYYLPFL